MVRIIAKLDIKGVNVIKPLYFEGLRKIGATNTIAEKYYHQGADEIALINHVNSLYQTEINFEEFQMATKNIFIPVTAGGGVRCLNDFIRLFHFGADKVAINTYAIQENPDILNNAAKKFGAQSIVVNIEAKSLDRNWFCYTDGGRIPTKKKVIDWAKEAQERGAGEIFLQSIDKDGSLSGFDLELINEIVNKLEIPVVACSGAGSLNHIQDLIEKVRPSGVAISSILHKSLVNIDDIKRILNR